MLPIGRTPGVPTEGSRLVTVSSGGLRSLTRSPSHDSPTRQSAPNLDGGAGQERTSYASTQLGPNICGPSRIRDRYPSNLGVRCRFSRDLSGVRRRELRRDKEVACSNSHEVVGFLKAVSGARGQPGRI